MTKFRTKLHEPRIEAVKAHPKVLDGVNDAAGAIISGVKARTERSSTIRPYGRQMIRQLAPKEGAVRVGTSWGPAVPVEYGTFRTPAQRVLLSAAEKVGRVEFS